MSWQDVVMTIGNLIFLVVLSRIAYNPQTKIEAKMALMNAAVLGEFAHVYWTLHMYGGSLSEAACAVLWSWIAIKRRL